MSMAFEHPALFYRGDQEFLNGILPFVRHGLAKGEPVAIAVPEINLALLRLALGDDADRITLIDMSEAGRNPGRIIPGVLRRFADAHRDRHVRIVGEPIWAGRSDTEYPACAQHEALINLAFDGRAVTILCPYDVGKLDARTIADAEVTHPTIIDGDDRWASVPYDPHQVIAATNQPLPAPPADAAVCAFHSGNLADVRGFTLARSVAAGLGHDRALDAELAINELAANSIHHGPGSGILRIWPEDGHLVCEVRDEGHLTDVMVGRSPVDASRSGGRGVLLVNYLADLVRTHTVPGSTTFRTYFRVVPAR
jgi:anti-sigma regulatory factor (Ser/Thr protein kinase)